MKSLFKRWRGPGRSNGSKTGELERASELYNDLGLAVTRQISTTDTQVLILIERVEGGVDYAIHALEANEVRSIRAGNEVATAIFKLDTLVSSLPREKRWTAMEYWLDHGKLEIDFHYEAINEDTPPWDRAWRKRAIERYFPGSLRTAD
ncbi:MAG: hypothetical protein AAF251_02245 [Pseudomonadota bacterium]